MKCQILFSRKNKKNIFSLPSAKNAQRVVKVKVSKLTFLQCLHCLLLTQQSLDISTGGQKDMSISYDKHDKKWKCPKGFH